MNSLGEAFFNTIIFAIEGSITKCNLVLFPHLSYGCTTQKTLHRGQKHPEFSEPIVIGTVPDKNPGRFTTSR